LRSSVRFLISGTGSRSSVFFGLASSGISDQQGSVVLEEDLLDLSLLGFVDVLLVVSDDTLGEGLTNGIDLRNVTTSSDSDSDVEVLESLETQKKDGFEDLDSEGLRFEQFNGWSIDSEDSLSGLNGGVGNWIFLSSEALHNLWHMVVNIDYKYFN